MERMSQALNVASCLDCVHAFTIYYGWRETRLDTTGAPVCGVTHTQLYCQNFRISSKRIRRDHRYSTDAIVCKAVADTPPPGVDSNETRYSYIPVVNESASVRFYLKKCVMPRLVPRIASQQFLNTSVQHALDI